VSTTPTPAASDRGWPDAEQYEAIVKQAALEIALHNGDGHGMLPDPVLYRDHVKIALKVFIDQHAAELAARVEQEREAIFVVARNYMPTPDFIEFRKRIFARGTSEALDRKEAGVREALKAVKDALGSAEWSSPKDAEALLHEIIDTHYPRLFALLTTPASAETSE
jgi:hypothetical protein